MKPCPTCGATHPYRYEKVCAKVRVMCYCGRRGPFESSEKRALVAWDLSVVTRPRTVR